MARTLSLVTMLAILICGHSIARAQGRPAPPPSRYGYTLKIDLKSLPKGVTVREVRDGQPPRWFIANASDVPLVLNEIHRNGALVAGTKLVSGKVYQYFPTGVPMEGKTHLKGWQAPFGDIKETLLYLPQEPAQIYAGRKPGLSKELPKPEPFSLPASYDGKPHPIEGTVHYHLNEAYDAFYKQDRGSSSGGSVGAKPSDQSADERLRQEVAALKRQVAELQQQQSQRDAEEARRPRIRGWISVGTGSGVRLGMSNLEDD